MTPTQCKAARALVGWTQADLANNASLSISTVADFERGRPRISEARVADMLEALSMHGVSRALWGMIELFGREDD